MDSDNRSHGTCRVTDAFLSPSPDPGRRPKIMETIPIVKVAKLSDGRLGVFPEVPKPIYQYVYRAAAGVSWDNSLGCFQSTVPREWTYGDWYGQIVSVVRSELGVRLQLSPSAIFDGGSESFREDILEADLSIQKWIDDTFPEAP